MDTESEAGPSRPRRPTPPHQEMDTDTDGGDAQSSSHRTSSRPASPETAFASRLHGSEAEPPHSPPHPPQPHLDLAAYPTATLLRLIANLLQQIASANDQIRPDAEDPADGEAGDQSHSSRSGSRASSVAPAPSPTAALFSERDTFPSASRQASGIDPSSPLPLFTASRTSLVHPSSLLSFHARHVPSISIEAYLLRILKYCPTTNEVFLSLLVYFDRMSRLGTASGVGAGLVGKNGKGFAIDSFNVHRLVIAGVTVASKFFSDVFYTNSRYAKVGGLPPHELNQLELQFLLLNDFRLAIPTDEMQRYGDRLLSYWDGREEETGVDVVTGRELSENGRRRAREKREKEREAREAEEREKLASKAMMEVEANGDGEGGWPKGEEIPPKEDGMEVDGDGAAVVEDPAQPPPEPAETASAPPSVDGDALVNGEEEISKRPDPPQHSATTPLPVISSKASNIPSHTPSPAPPPSVNGTRQKERSSSVVVPAPMNGSRSMSFSRGDVGGMSMGWGGGEQGVVAVSGTG